MKHPLIPFLCLALAMAGCKKNEEVTTSDTDVTDIQSLLVSPGFNYQTTQEISIRVKASDAAGAVLRMPNVEIYTKADSTGELLGRGMIDESGELKMVKSIPAYLKELVLVSNYAGVLNQVTVPIQNGAVSYEFKVRTQDQSGGRLGYNEAARITAGGFTYLGTYNSQGVPAYLEPANDKVDASFLADVNASLPENRPVPDHNPHYLAVNNSTDIHLKDNADVWVTFVSEGAGWTNALGYYTYPTNTPPTSVSDIQTKYIIFPNVSFAGSGGGLVAGNKVKIGRFNAGTSIGWFLVGNGWNGKTVGNGNYTHYSNPAFNSENNPSIRQHNVLLDDRNRGRVLLAFEDVRRDNIPIRCDQDFNDAIFYVSANPYSAIETNNFPDIKLTAPDADKDGVPDTFDAYPSDAGRAYNNYSPSEKTYGTLAYEDLWPSQGDYDMNDLVVNYQFNSVTNAKNQVVEIKSNFLVAAIGASYHNGFGLQLPISSSQVASVSGSSLTQGYVSLAANGTEAGQDKATIFVFDDAFNHIGASSGFSNTQMDQPKQSSDTLRLTIGLTAPLAQDVLGTAPFNPFIVVNRQRGTEVHLPGQKPTAKADATMLGKQDDNTNATQNIYYKTRKNLPFALHIPVKFAYPTEKSSITTAYLKFGNWAQSGGHSFADWYLNQTQYINAQNIYSK